ncbi:MAG: hypothetical protein V1799_05770 [bacterium]
MKIRMLLAVLLVLCFAQMLVGQQSNPVWEKWQYLLGTWIGEGSGQPGQGSGSFTFQTDLSGSVIIRKSQTTFPATKDKGASLHEDLLIIYLDYSGVPSKAIYFDNERHAINYTVMYRDQVIVFTSESIKNAPRFRLSYEPIDRNIVNTKFEIASPQNQDEFKTYIEGKSRRKE